MCYQYVTSGVDNTSRICSLPNYSVIMLIVMLVHTIINRHALNRPLEGISSTISSHYIVLIQVFELTLVRINNRTVVKIEHRTVITDCLLVQ